MFPIPAWVYGAGAALTLAAGFGAGWSVRDWKADSDQLAALEKAQEREDKIRDNIAGQATGYEATRAVEAQASDQRQEQIRVIYKDRIIDPGCALDPAAGSVLDSAIARANARASGEPEAEVPADPGPADPLR